MGAEKQRQLEAIELEIARGAQAQQGAGDLLAQLHYGDCRIGIVTRNSYENTLVTLQAAGLAEYFDRQTIISRACAQPKPHPDGIHRLLSRWTGHVAHCVMVGDYLFDMQCGREAGVTTVYLDQAGEDLWSDYADLVVRSLEQLQAYL
jgi:HAD superfamily hydrolase (TIGR01549 family)